MQSSHLNSNLPKFIIFDWYVSLANKRKIENKEEE